MWAGIGAGAACKLLAPGQALEGGAEAVLRWPDTWSAGKARESERFQSSVTSGHLLSWLSNCI